MPGNAEHIADHLADLEQGCGSSVWLPMDDLGAEDWSQTYEGSSYRSSGVGTTGNPSGGVSPEGTQKERSDFDGGANPLWTLYGKMAEAHDEARFSSLEGDLDAVGFFAALFSAVLASFLVQSIQNLQVNPAEKLVYYQNQSVFYQQQSAYFQQQSVAILAQISQHIASIAVQSSVPSTSPSIATPPTPPSTVLSTDAQQVFIPSAIQQSSIPSPSPLPYPAFKPSFSDIRVNACWLVSLICILSAALLVFFIKHRIRSYMQVFQRYDHPLKRARFRQFFLEGANGILNLAQAVPRLVLCSLFLFFLGLGDSMLNTNKVVGIITVVPLCLSGTFYLYSVSAHLWNPQSLHKTVLSRSIFFLMQKFPRLYFGARFLRNRHTPRTIEAYQEELVMEGAEERKERDVRAIRWLVEKAAANADIEPLVLAIPGTFNTEWGREVWMNVSNERWSDPDALELRTGRTPASGPAHLMHHSSRFPEGTAGDIICQGIRDLFETCRNHSYFENEEERRRRMRACVEATASLVCCIDFELEWFGEVGKLVSEIGRMENVNQSLTTTSDQSFIIRWTCLSLISVQQILNSNRLNVLADYAVSGLARFRSEYGYGQPDGAGWRNAQRIEECLKTAWERAEELHRAFEPWTQKKTREQVEDILRNHERQISDLERIKVDADAMEDVDWRISLYQDAQDEDTYQMTRQLPGVSFDERHRSESSSISDDFITLTTGGTPVTPQLIFPGQQVQALTRLGSKLREVLDGKFADGYKEVLERLKSIDQVPVSLRRPDGLMKRQLWRLQDLRDGAGLGYTVELFFLSLRQLLTIPSLHESSSVVYVGTFKIITSHWEKSKGSLGTQHILLNIICDLIIQGRGLFSEFKYPERITTMLLDTVDDMLQGHEGEDEHIHDAVQEIARVDSRTCVDMELRGKALEALLPHVRRSVV